MPRKNWTDEQRKAFGEKMKASRVKKATPVVTPKAQPPTEPIATPPLPEATEVPAAEQTDTQETDMQAMQRQMNEIMETNALLKAALLRNPQEASTGVATGQPQVNKTGSLIGVFEKYILSPENYPSPIERLAQETRLAPLAFPLNYHLDYVYSVRQYDTKQGINTQEPEFVIQLWRNRLNDDGTVRDRYRVRRLVFHEDPQAAMVIAHDNNIQIDKEDEANFLNEMRYLRVRDWLFDIFWPKAVTNTEARREEVIGNVLVEIVNVNSEDSVDMGHKLDSTNKASFNKASF